MMHSHHVLMLVFFSSLCAVEVVSTLSTDGPVPGGLQNVSKNDTSVKKAVLTGTYTFNNRSNDVFLFKASAIDEAKRKVVKGILYILTVEISRTVCRKMKESDDLTNCSFQSDRQLKQVGDILFSSL